MQFEFSIEAESVTEAYERFMEFLEPAGQEQINHMIEADKLARMADARKLVDSGGVKLN